MKLFLFDIDMTLVSTGGAGIRALDRAFREVLGLEGAMAGIAPHGKTDPAIIREACAGRGLGDEPAFASRFGRVLDRYVVHLESEVAGSAAYTVLPGILEILDELSERTDAVLGLATGNVEAGARIKLERGGLNRYFPFGGFGSDAEDRVEVVRTAGRRAEIWAARRLDPEETFVIGDTPLDVAAARQAGFQTIGVATGRYSAPDLAASGAGVVIADFRSGRDQFLRSTRIA